MYDLLQFFESKKKFRWKANPLTALILFLLIGSGTALSQFPPFQFLQKPGPYSVGLKVVNQYDPSRKFPATPDRPEAPGQGSRPLQTLIWYPALQSSSKPMTVGASTQSTPLSSQPRQQGTTSSTKGRTSTFIGYATNGSFFFPDIATSPGPLTTGGKFKLFVNQSISPPYVLTGAFSAAFNQARNVPEGYGQGWNAYASRFGANMARSSSSSFFGTFLFASLLHQDPRFFPQSKPSFWRGLKYSAQRIVITRNDAGKDVFNTSGLLGALASEGLANVYLPSSEQTAGKTVTRFAADLAWRVGGNMFKDYWPTFFRNMGLNRLKVIPDPGNPGLKQP